VIVEHRQVVVVGSGLAGLTVALSLAPLDTLVLTKTESSVSGSTPWAQGGVAFPRDTQDESAHIHDTLVSGAGHTDPESAAFLVRHAHSARTWLEDQGVVFDKDAGGGYHYGQEGAHSSRRILQVGSDGTGAGLAQSLTDRLRSASHVTLRPKTFAVHLVPGGILTLEADRGLVLVLSPRIFLAGGGLGQLFAATTAPEEATGDCIALGLEAGAPVNDLEMIQYHPTALALRRPGAPSLSLLSEALRGDGAILVTAEKDNPGLRPLDTKHPLGSLGPRDVLSRAIYHRQVAGFPVWLDARAVKDSARHFPTVTRLCAEVGLDPALNLLPVVPAVHYTMGGVVADQRGRTGLAGVWVAGETARTGVHGANRLASNSLLECVVWGRAAAEDALLSPRPTPVFNEAKVPALAEGWASRRLPSLAFATALKPLIQALMGKAAGPVRTARGLEAGLEGLAVYQGQWDKASSGGHALGDLTFGGARAILEVRNLLILGPTVLTQALARKDSLGAHFRGDE